MEIRKMANWKAPGPDGTSQFWFKKFNYLYRVLVHLGKISKRLTIYFLGTI